MTGSCNRCGLCCSRVVDGKSFVCEHLFRMRFKPLGKPNASSCTVWDARVPGMPVRLVSDDGESLEGAFCRPEFPTDGDELPEGCSYVKDKAQRTEAPAA